FRLLRLPSGLWAVGSTSVLGCNGGGWRGWCLPWRRVGRCSFVFGQKRNRSSINSQCGQPLGGFDSFHGRSCLVAQPGDTTWNPRNPAIDYLFSTLLFKFSPQK
ncbi:unnamed protein product, partial [Ectocarpus sp. 8 AP-2014]